MATNQSVRRLPVIDLREIFQTSATCLSFTGLTLNAILIYFIFFKSPKQIRDYKIVLIQNCFVDVFFTISNEIVKQQTDYKDGVFFINGSDILWYIPYPYNFLLIILAVFSLFSCITFIPVQFVYRYYIIIYGKALNAFQYFLLVIIATFGAVAFAVHFGFVTWPSEKTFEAGRAMLQDDIFYFRGIPVFMIANIQEWPLRINFAFGNFLVVISYGITVYTSWKVRQKLNDLSAAFSEETRKLHSQMTKTMILQATIPLIFVLTPVGCAMNFTFAKINVPGLGMIANLTCCWLPVANPLVTIFTVNAYKRIIFSFFHKSLARIRITPSNTAQSNNLQ